MDKRFDYSDAEADVCGRAHKYYGYMYNKQYYMGSKREGRKEVDYRCGGKVENVDKYGNVNRYNTQGNDYERNENVKNEMVSSQRKIKKDKFERNNYSANLINNAADANNLKKKTGYTKSISSSSVTFVNSTSLNFQKNEANNTFSSEDEENTKRKKNSKGKHENNSNNRNTMESNTGTSVYDDSKSSLCVDNSNCFKDSCWEIPKRYHNDDINLTQEGVFGGIDRQTEEKAKPYRCRYCEVDAVDCVVQCNNCSRWFCNGSSGTCGSHIITHLVRSKHKELKMHQNSVLGDTILECYKCGCKNVFLLGYLPTAEEQVVVIICRDPCLAKYLEVHQEKEESAKMHKKGSVENSTRSVTVENIEKKKKKERNCEEESEWDAKRWQPVIEDRALVDWLVNIPGKDDSTPKGKTTTSQYVNQLEELWKHEKEYNVEEINTDVVLEEPTRVELHYRDAHHYKSVFAPLIKLEADYDKSVKEGQKQGNVTVRWDIGLNKKRYAHFIYVKEESELRLVVGDELKLSYVYSNGTEWSCQGHISRLYNTEEIALELRTVTNAYGPWNDNITKGYTVEFVWKSTAFDRMQAALREFADNCFSLSGYLYHKILGHTDAEYSLEASCSNFRSEMEKKINGIGNFSAPDLADLNHSQIDAVKNALVSPLSLIQGPPGTGKTLTCATLVYHMSQMKLGKVLVTAPSNVAVDQLAVRIHRTGLKVVRVCARSREAVPSIADYLCLHNQLKHLKNEVSEELNKLLELKEEVGELSQKDEIRLRKLISYAEKEILISADVICTTCVGAMDKRLKRFQFRQVLVDEATQSTEPECLVPLVRGAKQIVLVGDHCQLGPIIVCKKAASAGLGKSLFERLVMLGTIPVRLEVQYRMHPCLSEFPSFVFYDGSLQNGVTLSEREYPLEDFPWPDSRYPMFFYNSTGLEEMSASGTSYLNRSEAYNMEKLVRTLLKCGLKPNQIGVITPYEGQRAYITSLFQRNAAYQHMSEIEVASVDAFQGREKDFILLSCVRSNKKLGIGFLNDPRRLNVALTRAKYGLIICGNAKVLSKFHQMPKKNWTSNETITNVNSIWILLLSHFQKRNLIMEGSITDLKPLNIDLPEPRKFLSKYLNSSYFLIADDEENDKDSPLLHKKKECTDNGITTDSNPNFIKSSKNNTDRDDSSINDNKNSSSSSSSISSNNSSNNRNSGSSSGNSNNNTNNNRSNNTNTHSNNIKSNNYNSSNSYGANVNIVSDATYSSIYKSNDTVVYDATGNCDLSRNTKSTNDMRYSETNKEINYPMQHILQQMPFLQKSALANMTHYLENQDREKSSGDNKSIPIETYSTNVISTDNVLVMKDHVTNSINRHAGGIYTDTSIVGYNNKGKFNRETEKAGFIRNFEATYREPYLLSNNGMKTGVQPLVNGIKNAEHVDRRFFGNFTQDTSVESYIQQINEIGEGNGKLEDGCNPLFPYAFYQVDSKSRGNNSLCSQFTDDINEQITLDMLRQQADKIHRDNIMNMTGEKMTELVLNMPNVHNPMNHL